MRFQKLKRFLRRHRTRTIQLVSVLMTILAIKATIVFIVLGGAWLVYKIATLKVPKEFETWR